MSELTYNDIVEITNKHINSDIPEDVEVYNLVEPKQGTWSNVVISEPPSHSMNRHERRKLERLK